MLRFTGTRVLQRPPEDAFAALTDCRLLVEAVPDVESCAFAEVDRAAMVLRPGFAFVRGTLDTTVDVVERTAPTAARLLLRSKGIGSSSEVEATMRFSPTPEGGTSVEWTAEVKSLGGLLKMVPAGLIRGTAEKVINDAWDRLVAKMA